MAKKCCFIVPYFGKLPENFSLVLKTCQYNQDYDWMIFTDDYTKYQYPANVIVRYCTFSEMRKKIQDKFKFRISLNSPKKLCDFKPCYGYIFADEIKEYPFWGYCDLDQYFGNLNSFFSEAHLKKYEKFFSLGHMTIYKNTYKICKIFERDYPKCREKNYIDILSSPNNFIFDEWPRDVVNINILAEEAGLNICYEWPMIDIIPYRSYFQGSIYDNIRRKWGIEDNKNAVIVWREGILFVFWLTEEGKLEKREVIYAHIQKRQLKLYGSISCKVDCFIIIPNKIICLEKDKLTDEIIIKYIKRTRVRSSLAVDENMHKFNNYLGLCKHRISKLYSKIGL